MTLDHRKFVAWTDDPWGEDRHGADVFELVKRHGLLPEHRLLDFGCGSLRVGRWLMHYLNPGNYFGIDPELWLVAMAKLEEVPATLWKAKRPTFDGNGAWNLDVFDKTFDYVIVSDVMVHASDWQIAKIIRGMAKVLVASGIGLADIIEKGHHVGDKWIYPEVAGHYPKCVTEAATIHGLACEELAVIERGQHHLQWFKFTRGPLG